MSIENTRNPENTRNGDTEDDDESLLWQYPVFSYSQEANRGHLTCMMESIWFILILPVVSASVFPNLNHVRPLASMEDQRQAAKDLIGRVLGPKSSSFDVVIIENNDPEFRDTFNLISDGYNVTISAISGVSASMGFYYFLKTKCGCQFTWAGEQLNLPSPLPVIGQPGLTVTANDRFRYYQNVCTSSYSFVWWDWEQWQRHIDWMAVNGINLPLAFTGQEAIFQRVYRKLGFTDKDLQHHFGGPAFLAWARMGNMHGWGGPLPQTWIDDQLALQHKILSRMRQLGMTPVLPGFAGHVPMAITKLYPNVKVSRLDNWGRFNQSYCCTYLLDFHEHLFQQIGAAFIKEKLEANSMDPDETVWTHRLIWIHAGRKRTIGFLMAWLNSAMKSEFGVDNIYNADTFNEMPPSSNDTEYIRSAGKAVYNAMVTGDPKAVWLMQGWLFVADPAFWQPAQTEALLTSVPKGGMIVLDLGAERQPVYNVTKSFYGQPFIWCMLHNFGGTMGLYGIIDAVNEGPFKARNFVSSTMIGTGLTPEGIHQNEVIYELMNENGYVTRPRNLTAWFTSYATNRYGKYNHDADLAWQLLKMSVYNNTDTMPDDAANVIPTSRPSLALRLPEVWYDPKQLYSAWSHMVSASTVLGNSKLFRYDLVDIARNSLQVISVKFYIEIIAAYHEKNIYLLKRAGNNLVQVLDDMDMLLGSDIHFLLGPWIRDARKHGHTVTEQNLMEYNARNQITLWGPNGEVRDYASKQWSGLISRYYTKRWRHFHETLMLCLEKDEPFNQASYDHAMFETVEKPFTFDRSSVPVEPQGDSVKMASDLFKKYRFTLQSNFYRHLKNWSQGGIERYNWLSAVKELGQRQVGG